MVFIQFCLLALIWGSSFFFMKIILIQVNPFYVSSLRIGIAAAFFTLWFFLVKKTYPRNKGDYVWIAWVGFFNTTLPFFLMAWATQFVDTGLVTVLNATVPLFSLTLGHFLLPEERLTPAKFMGLILGFSGVLFLALRNPLSKSNKTIALLAVLLAAFCYSISLITMRKKLKTVQPILIAGVSLQFGFLFCIPLLFLFQPPVPILSSLSTSVILAMCTLGILHTGIAYIFAYNLIEKWGTKASLVTFAMPPVGIALGVFLLHETLGWKMAVGTVFILLGIFLIKKEDIRPKKK